MIRLEEQEDEPSLNMAPMIDMVFLLLIFFLTATTFTQKEHEQDVLLPATRSTTSLSRSLDNNLIINVLQDGGLRVAGRPVGDDALLALVAERRERARAPLKVMIRADRRALYGRVARALEIVERAGVQRPYIVTKQVEMEP
jgi:biopolymer transport protein ExbD